MKINTHYQALEESYLFSSISKKVAAYQQANPQSDIIRLGIGDVTLPLCDAVVGALHNAVDEMGLSQSFHGYGPEQGYGFLKASICKYYTRREVTLEEDEVFVSDGAKSDLGNILDIFSTDNTVLIPDPVYPVYMDTNIMAGRKILFMNANMENGFLPLPEPSVQADIIYLCSPNNPTGAVYSHDMLRQWVDYALEQGAVILFDAAYEAFIQDDFLPRSIYEIPGAKKCAIEFCSFSKTAGFTGTRCGYTILPMELEFDGIKLNKMWLRRQTTKFNGVPYVVQRGAAAVFTPEGQLQSERAIAYYMENARLIAATMRRKGISFVGGENSPYIWLQCPGGMTSWDYFDYLLTTAGLVGTPGAGFGKNGERFFRLTAFGSKEKTQEAMERFAAL
ncbi:LL-diaminopimelate aminotransferase [Oscillospiraceae bacterium MB08-C2-2]|nr:LL-diaminopimelate aminotransferase [Oscillospiraceae bacterium MB08-C2-2]